MKKKKVVIVIPARFGSTRFPGKPLVLLGGKPIIQHVYEAVKSLGVPVIVATDNEPIEKAVIAFGGECKMTSEEHQSGSDRIAEVIKELDYDVIVNVQGDEPFIKVEPLRELISAFEDDSVQVASLMHSLKEKTDIEDPNNVKVVCSEDNNALYFSRLPIPYDRDATNKAKYFKHIGVYAYTKEALLSFIKLPLGNLEGVEKLEQLRYLENGFKIKMVETNYTGIGIDTPLDLMKAENYLRSLKG
ncbi:MAG: 3-deoxy-D-manno-octulosonate cytidylyltransferase [Candidatus Cloacimonetes bacterium 4572_65]|nr:MAG: 3-deoxy-D-manno-octulosonate cytidylyltransferase [Candidatus Cloacimonetes bacterium 4572_65]